MIFVDSDAFIGASVPSDPHYDVSITLFRKLKEIGEDLITSWDVVDEVATKLSYRAGKKTALEFLKNLKQSSIKIEYIDKIISKKSLILFTKQKSKNISLTDCTNMVTAKSLGIDIFFSFDKHYEKSGFKLLK